MHPPERWFPLDRVQALREICSRFQETIRGVLVGVLLCSVEQGWCVRQAGRVWGFGCSGRGSGCGGVGSVVGGCCHVRSERGVAGRQ